jgi:hypothetical protein
MSVWSVRRAEVGPRQEIERVQESLENVPLRRRTKWVKRVDIEELQKEVIEFRDARDCKSSGSGDVLDLLPFLTCLHQ